MEPPRKITILSEIAVQQIFLRGHVDNIVHRLNVAQETPCIMFTDGLKFYTP
jgi:hypothetical protein